MKPVKKKELTRHDRIMLRNSQGVSVKARAKEKVKVSLKKEPWPKNDDLLPREG